MVWRELGRIFFRGRTYMYNDEIKQQYLTAFDSIAETSKAML